MTAPCFDRSSTPTQLALLGGFELVHAGRTVSACASGARLLAFLALRGRGRPVARTALAERLWDDARPGQSSARLRSVLWRLPRADDQPLVTTTNTTVQLADFVRVDLWRAEEDAGLLAGNEPPEVRLGVFQNDLLPDWPEDWLVLEREAFRQTRLHALERASEHLRLAGSFAAALQAALAAVACEPLRETAHRRVIEVHLAEGNHAEALRQYQAFRRVLADQLGLPPTGAIRSLVGPLLGRPVDARRPGGH